MAVRAAGGAYAAAPASRSCADGVCCCSQPFLKASLLVPLLVLLLSISVNADTPTPRGTSDGPADAAVAAVANAAAAALPAAPALAATAFSWQEAEDMVEARGLVSKASTQMASFKQSEPAKAKVLLLLFFVP